MATFQDLIAKTYRRLEPFSLTPTVVLAGSIAPGATSMTVSDPSGQFLPTLQPMQRICIDLEVFLVQAVSNTLIQVSPGFDNSTEAGHNAGALVYINPRFTFFDIGSAINDDLADLSSAENGLFQVNSVEFTFNPAIEGYDLTDVNTGQAVTSLMNILSVRYRIPYPIGAWKPLHHGDWELTPQSDTAYFPSGYAFTLYRNAYPGLAVRVMYSAPFDRFVNLADDATAVVGLSPTMYDLPPLGAMISLVGPREVKRNQIDSEPDSRRAPEVPPGAVMNSIAQILRQRQNRINSESSRLQQLWGSTQT